MTGTNTAFRETGEAPKAGHLETESYFDPILFGDEDFEAIKAKVRERLIRETKASQKMELKIQRYESRVKTWNQLFKTVPGLRQDPVTVEGSEKQQPEEGTELCRWKYAFRELRPRKRCEPPHPTVITMRDGRYQNQTSQLSPHSHPHPRTRLANPLEELTRSWSKRPRGLSAINGQERLALHCNPDADDDKAKAISHADRIRRESLLRENGLLKRKK